ncbi:MAG TPA: OmpH family outer membrane protein [Sphingomicrobium sp.]
MKKMLVSAALAATVLVPSAAAAQALPAAVIAVVDVQTVTNDCNACKIAAAALRSQITGLQNREKALAAPLETEAKSLQAAADALNGKEPDAALQARAKAFQTKQQSAQTELARQQQQIARNQQYVNKQIADKLNPIFQQVMVRRGANILIEQGSTLATAKTVDVTSDVLAALNAALPSIATTAPAAPAQPKQEQPQGR